MSLSALLNTLGTRCRSLPLVIFYVTEGCNLQCITCSYRSPLPNELSLAEIGDLSAVLHQFGLRHIVYSGGEPLMRRDFPDICTLFHALGVRQSLLTNGVLLEKRLREIRPFLNEIIVSLDGPDEKTHDSIRGGRAFQQIVRGVRKALEGPGRATLSLRTVLQKRNFRSIIEMVRFAADLGVDRISFLAADVLSDSFGRTGLGPALERENVILTTQEVEEFRALAGRMATECAREFASGFIAESPQKIYNIVRYFEALLGRGPFPQTVCNAPMVSAVITSTGDLLPCFFLPAFANLRDGRLPEQMNNPRIRATRNSLREGTLDRCKTCVCTLSITPAAALLGRF